MAVQQRYRRRVGGVETSFLNSQVIEEVILVKGMNERMAARIGTIFAERKAILTNVHVVLKSGKHGNAYVNKDAVYPSTAYTSELCSYVSQLVDSNEIDVVIGPIVGGAILSQWTAYHLSDRYGREVLSTFADKDGDGFIIKRGYEKLMEGRKVLVVEDILTTGGSVAKVVALVRALGGEVVAVAALCNRGGVTNEALGGVPQFFSLMDVTLDSWEEEECPLCKDEVQITTEVGKGSEYLAKKASALKPDNSTLCPKCENYHDPEESCRW